MESKNKFADFKTKSKEEREKIIKNTKNAYCITRLLTALFVVIWLIFTVVQVSHSSNFPILITILFFVPVFAIILVLTFSTSNAVLDLNKVMTLEEKEKFFGENTKLHKMFKSHINFKSSESLYVVKEDESKQKKKRKMKCSYCGGKIKEDDEVCPGCGSRQFIEK